MTGFPTALCLWVEKNTFGPWLVRQADVLSITPWPLGWHQPCWTFGLCLLLPLQQLQLWSRAKSGPKNSPVFDFSGPEQTSVCAARPDLRCLRRRKCGRRSDAHRQERHDQKVLLLPSCEYHWIWLQLVSQVTLVKLHSKERNDSVCLVLPVSHRNE